MTNGVYQLMTASHRVYFDAAGFGGTITAVTPSALMSGGNVDDGSTLVLQAIPDSGYAVDAWTVNNVLQTGVTGNSLTISNVTELLNITVSFKRAPSALTYSAVGGKVTLENGPSSGSLVNARVPLAFTATADKGWSFYRWEVTTGGTVTEYPEGSVKSDGSYLYSTTMPGSALDVKAIFTRDSYTLTLDDKIKASFFDGVSTQWINSGDQVQGGTEVTLTVPGYTVGEQDNWYTVTSGSKTVISGQQGQQYYEFTMAEDVEFAVDASVEHYTGTWTESPADAGSIEARVNGGAALGENVNVDLDGGVILSLTAIPVKGKVFSRWTVDAAQNGGGYIESGSTITFPALSADVTVTAVFADAPKISVTISDNSRPDNVAKYVITVDGEERPAQSAGTISVDHGSTLEIGYSAPSGMFAEAVSVNTQPWRRRYIDEHRKAA